RLSAHGIGHEPVETYGNGVRHVVVTDPDGNNLSLAEAPPVGAVPAGGAVRPSAVGHRRAGPAGLAPGRAPRRGRKAATRSGGWVAAADSVRGRGTIRLSYSAAWAVGAAVGRWGAQPLSHFRNWLHRPAPVGCSVSGCAAAASVVAGCGACALAGAGSAVKRAGSAVRPRVKGPGRQVRPCSGTARAMSGNLLRRFSSSVTVMCRAGSFEGQPCGPALHDRCERLPLPDWRAAVSAGLLLAAAKLTMTRSPARSLCPASSMSVAG